MNPYVQLKQELEAHGCFARNGRGAVCSLVAHVVVAAACYGAAAMVGLPWGLWLCVLGSFMFFRIGWLMHDAAHGSACADVDANEAFAVACCAVLGEFLSGWRFGHNRHHAAPNVRGRDSDQSERWDARYRYRSAVVATADLFFFHRFGRWVRVPKTLFLLGLRDGFYAHHANRPRFFVELAWVVTSQLLQLGACLALFGPWGVGIFVLHSHVGIVYLNAIFSGNHYDLPSYDAVDADALPAWELQVRTARNYGDDVVTRFVCGGL
jgi:fatty acid desaturase